MSIRAFVAAIYAGAMATAGDATFAQPNGAVPTTGDAAAAFGAMPSVMDISLSPDGKTIAFVAPTKGAGNALYFAPLAGGAPRRTLVATGDPEQLIGCNWVSASRVVCNVYSIQTAGGRIYGSTRMVAVNSDGSNIKLVSKRDQSAATAFSFYGGGIIDWLPDEGGAVLATRPIIPQVRDAAAVWGGSWDGMAVERIDTNTLATKQVVSPNKQAVEFISDGHGAVRIMGLNPDRGATGYSSPKIKYLSRLAGGSDWRPLSDYDSLSEQGFNPYAVDRDTNSAIGLMKLDGRQALYRRSLDGSLTDTLIFAHPQVDIDGLIRIGRAQRVIGLTFATERRQSQYFDPAYVKLTGSLTKVLPGNQINFEGATSDESKLMIWAGSDTRPGTYYLFDKSTKQLNQLLLSRPELEGYKLAEVKPVSVRAGDGTMIPAYLTLPPGSSGKNLPAIVLPHGGPSARDEWGFDWLSQFYANRGFAVLQPNFRGSAGYGDAWLRKNGFQSWSIAIGDVLDSGRWLVSQGIADPKKLAIVGWSYGGYAALQSGVVAPDLFRAIVAVAPVTDFDLLREEYRGYTSFANARDFIGTGPHIKAGSPAQHAAKFTAPVLMFHPSYDMNVDIRQSQVMENRLKGAGKRVELITYPKLEHSIRDSSARADLLRRSEAFLRANLGMN